MHTQCSDYVTYLVIYFEGPDYGVYVDCVVNKVFGLEHVHSDLYCEKDSGSVTCTQSTDDGVWLKYRHSWCSTFTINKLRKIL